jgi:spermidine synthase
MIRESPRVGDDGGRAALLVDGVVQSISPEDGLADGGYWAAMLPRTRPRRGLILGLGGGTLARLLCARWGAVPLIGVDDDGEILALATELGWLSHLDNLEVVIDDAFDYVQTCRERFDYVAVDLFRGEQLEGRAFRKPFLRRVRTLLEHHGWLAINLFTDRRATDRVARVAAIFEIREQTFVGGNVIVHARRRT